MKYFLLLFSILIINACTDDSGTIKVTYTKATAIYGSLDELRSNNFNEPAREIENPGKIFIGENFVLIGEENEGIHVIDNADSKNPQSINFMVIKGNKEFYVKDNVLYADNEYDVIKLDISDLNNIKLIKRAEFVFGSELSDGNGKILRGFEFNEVTETIDSDTDIYQEISQNDYVYFDYADKIIPQSSVPSSFAGNSNETSGTINRITHHKEHVYIAGRFDLSVIEDNTFTLIEKLENIGNEMETVFPYENNLFVGSRSSMEISDISDATLPKQMYRVDHATSCDPVLVKNETAYVTLRTADFSPCPGNINALVVIDVSEIDKPRPKQEIEMASPYGMSQIGNILYVGEGDNGLSIFDATNPQELVLLDHKEDIKAYDIIEHPTRTDLILIAGKNGLEQYLTDQSLNFSIESKIEY